MSTRLIMYGSAKNVEKNSIKEGIPMYDKTVTVFNKYTDKNDAIYWYPHVLSGVTLITDKAANVAKTG